MEKERAPKKLFIKITITIRISHFVLIFNLPILASTFKAAALGNTIDQAQQ
jgi:hypothetical protein